MRPEAKGKFFKLLGEVMTGYGKELDPKTMEVWFAMLAPFEPATIRRAFDAYAADRPDFAPAPNGIAARCKLLDGRPEENEAWALALASQDEQETVVWTAEMSQAFAVALPMLNGGDEIGARMAFKDAYSRMVAEARAANRPTQWSVSAGWNVERRADAVRKAVTAGLLEGEQPHLAIGYVGEAAPARPEGLQRLLETCAHIFNQPIEPAPQIDERDQQLREESAQKVRDYQARIDAAGRKSIFFNPDKDA